jgi:hypothetical protein
LGFKPFISTVQAVKNWDKSERVEGFEQTPLSALQRVFKVDVRFAELELEPENAWVAVNRALVHVARLGSLFNVCKKSVHCVEMSLVGM